MNISVKAGVFVFLFLMIISKAVIAADCRFYIGNVNDIAIDVGDIQAPIDSQTGTVLYRKVYQYDSIASHQGIMCSDTATDAVSFVLTTTMSNALSSVTNTYNTNIDGIGIRLSLYDSKGYAQFPANETNLPFTTNIFINGCATACNNNFGTGYMKFVLELIKTAQTTSAGSLSYSVSNLITAGNLTMANIIVSANIKESTCNVDAATPDIVQLSPVTVSALPSIGSTVGATAFSVKLNCQGSPKVSITLTDKNQITSSEEGVLNIDADSTSSGVGVQLLFNNNPVKLGEALDVGVADNSAFEIPFVAQIIRTDTAISPGSFTAGFYYNISYL
ncbi:fimbrial protein [Enterobacter cloacae]|uniref:fimbrial protein n=1 Tax=Enterobacter cloacae complex TaxID=354276 RepID=UPI00350F77DD